MTPMALKWSGAVLLAVFVGLVHFGLYHYMAHDWTLGLKCVRWAVALVLLMGIGLQVRSLLVPVWLGSGLLLAYLVGWWWLGGKCRGWPRHLVRASCFGLCLGPLAAIPGSELRDVAAWWQALASMSSHDVIWTAVYSFPAFYLAAAGACTASLVSAFGADTGKPASPHRLLATMLVASILPCLAWYIGGCLSINQAAAEGRTGLLRFMLRVRPGLLRAPTGASGMLPLGSAAIHGSAGALRALLDAGADANGRDRFGMTALHYAAWSGSAESTTALLVAGADPLARSSSGCTALHYAVEDAPRGGSIRRLEIIRALLKRGSDVNARARNGSTPLHWAAKSGQLEIVVILLAEGADVHAATRPIPITPCMLAPPGSEVMALLERAEAGPGERMPDTHRRGPESSPDPTHTQK